MCVISLKTAKDSKYTTKLALWFNVHEKMTGIQSGLPHVKNG